MDTCTLTLPSALDDGRTCLAQGDYHAAAEIFSRLQEQHPYALYYVWATTQLQHSPSGEELLACWDQVKEHFLTVPDSEAQLYALCAQDAIRLLAFKVYRDCNENQLKQYTLLNKDVSFEKKEQVLSSLQKILLEADRQYSAIFHVLFSLPQVILERIGNRDIEPTLLRALFENANTAAELCQEVSLPADLDLLELAAQLCALPLPDDSELTELRNSIVRLALSDPAALERWDFWAEFAQAAGVDRSALEKKGKKLARKAKIKKLLSFKRGS